MTGKRGVDNGRPDPLVLHYIDHRCDQIAGAPCECAARLQNDLKPWIARTEITQQSNKMVRVVAFTRHQMSASHIDPFHLRQQMSELTFKCLKHSLQIKRCRFTQGMEVKSLHSIREFPAYHVGHHSEP